MTKLPTLEGKCFVCRSAEIAWRRTLVTIRIGPHLFHVHEGTCHYALLERVTEHVAILAAEYDRAAGRDAGSEPGPAGDAPSTGAGSGVSPV